MSWMTFRNAAPELAGKAEELFELAGVVLLGTVRKDGSPRISPVEPLFMDAELYLGMMWRSFKALDLKRDPRCTIHNAIRDRFAKEGEVKVHGKTREILDLDERARYCDGLKKKIDWAPTEPRFHVFAVAEISSAALFVNGKNDRSVTRWRAGEGVTEHRQTI